MASEPTLSGRIGAATPPGRDRAVDGLRALAILGVVLGHWLVTALVADSGSVRVTSPLKAVPELAPISWVFQTLALFFLVGGMTAAKSYASATNYGPWIRARLARLSRPVVPVLLVWCVAAGGMLVAGAELETVTALVRLVVSPLWFLLVFAALTAATPLAVRLHPVWPLAVVATVDLLRYGLAAPDWLGWVNLAAGWLVPYTLGAAWTRGTLGGTGTRGGLGGRGAGWVLLVGGGVSAAALVVWAGYPASMVGVPGAAISNLNPPTLAAVAFGLAQCGAALLAHGPLTRALRRPAAWAAVALANLSAMTVFLWHQTAMIAVTALGLAAAGPLPGLHTAPVESDWVVARVAWLPVFAAALLVCVAAFRSAELRRA
ncbi:acyltransferase [Nonomuraea sp. NPDC059007]|uniref:acyltransferase family protein n=1 Tax=Nonomuraea sp. NPDC059007 TaxID=3346692 RepID=UPI00369D60EC